jgi:hypothetical protein
LRSRTFELATQQGALEQLAQVAAKDVTSPVVIGFARKITNACDSRDDQCELDAVYDWVKSNIRYVSDPRSTDLFMQPANLLKMYEKGAGGGDCDDHASLIVALLASLGWHMGLRAWGRGKNQNGDYVHVYAVAGYPKKNPTEDVGLDTTVEDASVGWEPPGGHVLTAWLE